MFLLISNSWVDQPISLSGETLYYSVYNQNSNQRTQFKKVGDADPRDYGLYSIQGSPRIIDSK